MHLKENNSHITNNMDAQEITKFEAMAAQWWDKKGKFKPLHMLNPTRLDYIIEQITRHFNLNKSETKHFSDLRILDIGCGGGLLSEPIASLGAIVVGADAVERNITVARLHAQQSNLDIDYRHTSTQELVENNESFDVILNMEVIEHVADPVTFINDCQMLLNPGGLMICSTINRNLKSYLMAIIGAERIMRWLPVGTHQFKKFIQPKELTNILENSGLKATDKRGFVFNPFSNRWSTCKQDLSVNYVISSSNTKSNK